MVIYIIRHTKVANMDGVCYGQSNVPLADSFLAELEHFKQALPTDFDAIFCSPLERCQKLSNGLFPEKNSIEDARLMEMNFGDWENQKWDDINQAELNVWIEDFVNVSAPNGENLLTVFNRTQSFLDDLKERKHEKILIVAHAGVIRCVHAYFSAIPLKDIFKIKVNFGEIFIF